MGILGGSPLHRALVTLLIAYASIFVNTSSAVSQTKPKTITEYWATTNLDFEFFAADHNAKTCVERVEKFQGCLYALTAALDEQKPKASILTRSLYEQANPKPKVIADFNSILVIELPAVDKNEKVIELIKKERANRKALLESLAELYRDPNRSVDFDKIFNWVNETIVSKSPAKARISAEMVNLDLTIVEGPYSAFIPSEKLKDEYAGGAALVGIGVEIKEVDQYVVIIRPIKGGPAHRAGLQPKDLIVAVNGIDMKGKPIDDVVSNIRGEAGSKLKLRIRRGADQELEFELERASVKPENVVLDFKHGQFGDYAHLQIRDFMEQSICESVRTEVLKAKDQNPRGMILDLRNNPGGLMDAAVCISGIFVPGGKKILSVRHFNGRRDVYLSQNPEDKETPMIVLMNAFSASASEIVGGVLQDLDRALVMGVRTYGKGTFQTVRAYSFQKKLHRKSTGGTYHLPSDRTPQAIGISPSIEVYNNPNPSEEDMFFIRQEDEYLNKVPAQDKPWAETRPEFVRSIQACMLERGRAKEIYESTAKTAAPEDYQLLSAVDALDCQQIIRED